jgi:hypothetical protein
VNEIIGTVNADHIMGEVKEDKNYALEKVRDYHEEQKDIVLPWTPIEHPLRKWDRIYCSKIFTFTDISSFPIDERWICGGTGFDVKSKLPPEIESRRPKKNYGFCSRGCIRNCQFCCVREKEGDIRADADIYDLWDGVSKDILLRDNNILALPDHFEYICKQAKKHRIRLDFNQGLDIRLFDRDAARMLKSIRHGTVRFAFDSMALERIVLEKIKLMQSEGIMQATWYVLIGFDTSIEEDIYRFELLRNHGQRVNSMPYRKVTPDMPDGKITPGNAEIYKALDNYGSMHLIFHKYSFREYLDSDRGSYYKKYFREIVGKE